jgi:hypothetical protein
VRVAIRHCDNKIMIEAESGIKMVGRRKAESPDAIVSVPCYDGNIVLQKSQPQTPNNFSPKQVTLWLRCIAFENNALLTKIGSLKCENKIIGRRKVEGRKQARMVFTENLRSEAQGLVIEGRATQTPTPLNRPTLNFKILTPQLWENNTIFVINNVFFVISQVPRFF